jgi:hypothetical protein
MYRDYVQPRTEAILEPVDSKGYSSGKTSLEILLNFWVNFLVAIKISILLDIF